MTYKFKERQPEQPAEEVGVDIYEESTDGFGNKYLYLVQSTTVRDLKVRILTLQTEIDNITTNKKNLQGYVDSLTNSEEFNALVATEKA